MVLCQSSKAVPSGKLCDAIHRTCPEARLSVRRIDVSTLLCVFEFARDDAAEAMLAASIPNTTMTKPEAFFWVVDSVDSNHVGHSQPYRECEKNLYLTYAMKSTAKVMADSGCSDADIGDYLSSRGCSGTLTSHRLKYNVDAVRQELEDYTVISQPGETEAEALLRVLKETKCRFIYLYTTAPTDITAPSELTVATSDNH